MSEMSVWRVVFESGGVREVVVHKVSMGDGDKWSLRTDGGPWFSTPRMAVASLALSPDRLPIAEIRGPGELTTAEAVKLAIKFERDCCVVDARTSAECTRVNGRALQGADWGDTLKAEGRLRELSAMVLDELAQSIELRSKLEGL